MSDYDWRFENSINQTKVHQKAEGNIEHKYMPWRTNSSFSNYIDTVLYSNEMNMYPQLDSQLQYDYLFYSIKPKKRFYKRNRTKLDSNFELVSQYYKYDSDKTKEALRILTPDQIEIIKQKQEKGGVK